MKSVSISGSLRENVGKKDAKSQRAKGLIPAVLYGNKQQKHLLIDEKAINPLIYTPEVKYVELTVGEETHKVIIQELQFHPVSDKLLHVDFLEILDNKPITIEIPILVEGSSPGVLQGGKLSKKARKIKVKGLLEHIPENIKLNISKLNILDSIKVEDVKVANIDIVEIPSKVLVSVLSSRSVEVSEESTKETAEQKEPETKE
ncbi:MAG: 50S ribosomal protein L25 [Bacteroidales bacterium]|jgi:large subunit ribosomal protein L25|nr:50S ribosomal protein L25 [Bacteroidales bacterium]MDD3692027.1 50S ribosomal protein L25 [Bacteroidales bacterium]NLO41892.1 50S ribosomal protein L25 [Bacteroidales bacterium]